MNKREKILLGLLSTLLMIYLGQKATSLVKNDNKALIKQYSTSDLQKFITQPKLSINQRIDVVAHTKNFFFKFSKKKTISKKPVLDEIIPGPQGYAAMISGSFVLEGDKIFGFVVNKIEEKRVLLRKNNQTRILKRK